MQVILLESLNKLGKAGDIVTVVDDSTRADGWWMAELGQTHGLICDGHFEIIES